jgi:hypothetical protein
MRQYLYIFLIGIFIPVFSGYYFIVNTTDESFKCKKGLMSAAWYEYGKDEQVPNIPNIPSGFLILVDTSQISKDFVSASENFKRKNIREIDSLGYCRWWYDWGKLDKSAKARLAAERRKEYVRIADSIHQANNGVQKVWLINNTSKPVYVQMQDGSYMCVMEGLTKNKVWRPIQYWQSSWCGNSYYSKAIGPDSATSFVCQIPSRGDYRTKLRFKLLGYGGSYLSNEFDGTINYCEFVEDSSDYELNWRIDKKIAHLPLDSFLR